MNRRKTFVIAGCVMLLPVATPGLAQSGTSFICPSGDLVEDGTPGSRPLPGILRYAVSSADNPLPTGAMRETREANVVGGDAERGWLIIDVKFDTAVPRGCNLPIILTSARDSGDLRVTGMVNEVSEVFDGIELVEGRPILMPHLDEAMAFVGDGTDQARFRIPIRATTSARPKAHGLKLVFAFDYARGLPLTVNVLPLPALTLVAPPGGLAGGSVTLLRAELGTALLPGTAQMPVTFRLSSGTLGRWQTPVAAGSLAADGEWDESFVPIRAEKPFIAATSQQPLTGTVSATFGGSTATMAISIAPSAPPPAAAVACEPVFTVASQAGGLQVAVANRAKGKCQTYLVRPRALGSLLAPYNTAAARLAIPADSSDRTATAEFTLTAKGLASIKPGTRLEFDIAAEGASGGAAPPRIGITLSTLDLARILGKAK
jgi:hypothetical protein